MALSNGDLDTLLAKQLELQQRVIRPDWHPMMLSDEERAETIKNMCLALADEVHEALGEVGWKPWASSRHLNRDAFVGELIDALHFLLSLFLLAEAGGEEIMAKYDAKNRVNHERQIKGYTGLEKDSAGRALDEPA